MSPQVTEQLDPQPFRDWVDAWLGANPDETAVERLVFDLGIGERRLRRWRHENSSLERIEVEEALHRAGTGIWEVYPEVPALPILAPQQQPGYRANLTEAQLLELHRLHVAGVPVKVLAERVWKVAGFASWVSAEKRIRVGFSRLGLSTTRGLRHLPPARRCTAVCGSGERCGQAALKDSDQCFHHDPSTRDKARETHRRSVETRLGEAA